LGYFRGLAESLATCFKYVTAQLPCENCALPEFWLADTCYRTFSGAAAACLSYGNHISYRQWNNT
jgi:hypothetical protein